MCVESGEIMMFKKWDLELSDQNQQLSISPSLPSARDLEFLTPFFQRFKKESKYFQPLVPDGIFSSLPRHLIHNIMHRRLFFCFFFF